ncbi:GbsR/MarR family transcriptional regulator [Salisaeta longa]|uniref:GbsR/MarR family transcriptional regulator n=1 Tax=Salisaeta longa TaxID=503170 RepID=UPI0003B7AFB6|nr:transcriptional regulator [Salisaeta longa]
MSDAAPLTATEQELIEEFGNIYESYGLKRLQGLIVGLLLTQDDPASLDDMVALLNHSKGPISIAVRRLADIGLVRKVNGPINRRNYYAAHPDIFYNNFKFNMATVRKNRALAERLLNRIAAEGRAHQSATADNLEHMLRFYQLMESFYQDFSDEWAKVKAERRAAANGEA